MPFRQPELKKQISKLFRMQYIKDVACAMQQSDYAEKTMQFLIWQEKVEILQQLINDDDWIDDLYFVYICIYQFKQILDFKW